MRFARITTCAAAVALMLASAAASAQSAPPVAATAPAAVTPAQAAAFLGDWVLSAEGPQGPVAFSLTVKTDAGKVVGEISSEMAPKQSITDITKSGESLLLSYTLDWQGTPVPVSLTLIPATDTTRVHFSFANGQFEMDGTAKKTES